MKLKLSDKRFHVWITMSSIFLSILLILLSCAPEQAKDNLPPYADLENIIRSENDGKANFTWDQYIELMKVLSDKKFIVLPINEMRNKFDNSAVIVGLRHDIDVHPFKALEMANIEKSFGFRATYYVLATAEYYGNFINSIIVRYPEMAYLYQDLYKTGAEIGIHNDLLTLMIQYNCDPLAFNLEEINYYNSIGIPIYGTASHGSTIAKNLGVANFEIFSDFATRDSVLYNGVKYQIGKYSLKDYGFGYEAYHIDYNKYFSESGGSWRYPESGSFNEVLEKLKACVPGDRIEILTHPVWWGKK